MSTTLHITAVIAAFTTLGIAAPSRADAGPGAAERDSRIAQGLADVASHTRRAAAGVGRALAATENADRGMPIVARGTDRRSVAILFLPRDGELDDGQAETLRSLMRCRSTGRTREVSPGLVSMLADLAEAFPGRAFEFVSGYRAPPNGAPNSKHFHGQAVDIRIPGVPIEDVRDYLWTAHTSLGLGYYPRQGFIHLDYRPGSPDIAWTAVQGGARYHYHPAWARALRQDRERQSRVGL